MYYVDLSNTVLTPRNVQKLFYRFRNMKVVVVDTPIFDFIDATFMTQLMNGIKPCSYRQYEA